MTRAELRLSMRTGARAPVQGGAMKKAILAIVALVVLGTAAALACVSDPQGRIHFDGSNPYCGEGGHGCVECDSYDQSGDYLSCFYSGGTTICTGRIGGRPYTI